MSTDCEIFIECVNELVRPYCIPMQSIHATVVYAILMFFEELC